MVLYNRRYKLFLNVVVDQKCDGIKNILLQHFILYKLSSKQILNYYMRGIEIEYSKLQIF